MNTYEFINSRDIKKHLKEIKYNFLPLESVYIIWQSKMHTIEEKHKAYREIINKMPNYNICVRALDRNQVKLSDFLSEYIAIENELINKFNDNETGVYSYKIDGLTNGGALYPNKEMCIAAMKHKCGSKKCTLTKHLLATEITDTAKNIKLQMNENGECVFVVEESFLSDIKKKIFNSFWKMHFDIPIPFVKGDLIIERYGEAECQFYYSPSETVYSGEDMTAWYFDISESEDVIIDNYLNLEYYYDYRRMDNVTDEDLPF